MRLQMKVYCFVSVLVVIFLIVIFLIVVNINAGIIIIMYYDFLGHFVTVLLSSVFRVEEHELNPWKERMRENNIRLEMAPLPELSKTETQCGWSCIKSYCIFEWIKKEERESEVLLLLLVFVFRITLMHALYFLPLFSPSSSSFSLFFDSLSST